MLHNQSANRASAVTTVPLRAGKLRWHLPPCCYDQLFSVCIRLKMEIDICPRWLLGWLRVPQQTQRHVALLVSTLLTLVLIPLVIHIPHMQDKQVAGVVRSFGRLRYTSGIFPRDRHEPSRRQTFCFIDGDKHNRAESPTCGQLSNSRTPQRKGCDSLTILYITILIPL